MVKLWNFIDLTLAKELIAYQAEQYIRQVEAKLYAKETLQYLKAIIFHS